MHSYLNRTFKRLSEETPIAPESVVVAVCPPITADRFGKEVCHKAFLPFFSRRKEFAKMQYHKTWEEYEKNVAIHVLKNLYNMKTQHGVNVLYDVGYKQFKYCLNNPDYQVIFLIAHHIQKRQTDEIEFADGGHSVEKVINALEKLQRDTAPSVFFIVCNSDGIQKEMLRKQLSIGSIGSANWNMPFESSTYFLEIWASFFNHKNTLLESYELAIQHFWNLNT